MLTNQSSHDLYSRWWYGKTARAEAEQILRSEGTDGSFLVRESEANPGQC